MVRTTFLPSTAFKHIPTKIRQRYLGPFKVVKIVSPVAYTLELPSNWRIHLTFYVEKLKKFERREEFQYNISSPPKALEVEGEQKFEVETII